MNLLAECADQCSFVQSYWGLLTDGPHWAMELTVEALSAIGGMFVGRFWLKRHDRKVHDR